MSATSSSTSAANGTAEVRFHLSLNVDDLARSVEFFCVLFDSKPARHERDYAKFELTEPPLVLSLEPAPAPRGGKLNHLGFRLPSAEALVALQRRLELLGLATSREEGVACCYSKQTKFWVADPDGNLWELYTLDEEGERRFGTGAPTMVHQIEPLAPAPSMWAHRLGDAVPARILAETGGVDEVLLQGTFNARSTAAERAALLAEVLRILKPAGRLTLHQLSATTSIDSLAAPLPGPAAVVERVPSPAETTAELVQAGFVDLQFDKLDEKARFAAEGIECRETRVSAWKPFDARQGARGRVLYRGPFTEVTLDGGPRFTRGQWTEADASLLARLRSERWADQFTIDAPPESCG